MGKLSENRKESLEKLFHVAYDIALKGCPHADCVHELQVQKLQSIVFHLKTNDHAENSLTSTKNQYSIRHLKFTSTTKR